MREQSSLRGSASSLALTSGAQSADYQTLATRGTVVSITPVVLVLLILALMVFKPTF